MKKKEFLIERHYSTVKYSITVDRKPTFFGLVILYSTLLLDSTD